MSPTPPAQQRPKRRTDATAAGIGTSEAAFGPQDLSGLRRVQLLEATVAQFPGGIAVFDRDLQMVLCNERLKILLDYPDWLFAAGLPSMERLFAFNAERGEYGAGETDALVARRMALAREGRAHVYERERPNGTVLEIRGAPLAGGGFVTTYFDVTERRRAQDLVSYMATHDALTRLPNRSSLMNSLASAISAARGTGFAVHYLDLDGFKAVNDGFGHGAGDTLLKAVAERLKHCVRETDSVARLGGDEFAVVQAGVECIPDAVALASRLLARIGGVYATDRGELRVGVSIGISFGPCQGVTPDALLSSADAALYRSKAAGRGVYSLSEDRGCESPCDVIWCPRRPTRN